MWINLLSFPIMVLVVVAVYGLLSQKSHDDKDTPGTHDSVFDLGHDDDC